MKILTEYQCELCNMRYNDRGSAIRCEERGPGKEYPIGCMYGNHEKGDMYEDITFAVALNRVEGHANWGSSWACRDNGAGDSLGLRRCGGNSMRLNKHNGNLDPTQPHFIRMIKYLRSEMIEIMIWDGEKAVNYATWMRNYREKEHEKQSN